MTGNFNEDDFERLNIERSLTAYFDNALSPAERVNVEAMLAKNPNLRALLGQWQESGDALRQLPRHSLGDDFSAVVRSKIDSIAMTKSNRPPVVASNLDSQRIGMGGVAALAALLLLTLFVFPKFMGDGLGQHAGLVFQDVARDPILPPKVRPKPIIAPRNSSLPRNPNRFSSATSSPEKSRGIEQVLLIQNATLSDLEAVLHRHAIRIVDSKGETPGGVHLVPKAKQGMEAIHIVSQKGSMENAINEIAGHESIVVTAFTISGQLGSLGIGSSQIVEAKNSSAFQLQPIDLSDTIATSLEIEDLDQWFKLSDGSKGRELIECLLLIHSASKN